jgi:hypothetical protein
MVIGYEDLKPGMRVRPFGGLGDFRTIDEVEHLGSRVMVGYTDDLVNVFPYPDTTQFIVAGQESS